MSSPTVSTFQPGMVGTSMARLVLPHADGKAPAMYLVSPAAEARLRFSSGLAGPPSAPAGGKPPGLYWGAPGGGVTLGTSLCSASRPSSRAMTAATRRAKPFLPTRALPPYPDPNDQISRVSGKCTMYLLSALHGHGTSAWPGSSGAPTECRHGTNSPSAPSTSRAPLPMRVMIRMLVTT